MHVALNLPRAGKEHKSYNEHVRSIGQGEADAENIRGLNLATVKLATVQVTRLPL
jgi:hypothetical protein